MKKSKKKRKKESKVDQGCSVCARDPQDGEAFRCYDNTFKFNIDIARKFVSDGREPVEMEHDDVVYSINRAEINEQHVAHVDPSIPGIIAHVFFPTKSGEVVHAHRLIDGHHRAARSLQLGTPYFAFLLTEQESVAILERCPEGARPAQYLPAENS
jgi:hypothetical protein